MLIKLLISLLIISLVQGKVLFRTIKGSEGSPSGFNELECGFNEAECELKTDLEGEWIWSKGNETIVSNDQFNITIMSKTHSRLILKNYTGNNDEKVYCEFQNSLNCTIKETLEFWTPQIVDSNNIKSITVTEDSKHTFTCELEATDKFKNETVLWRWTKNNKILDNNNTKNFSLIVGKLDAGFYTCQPYLNNLTRIVINIDSKRIFKLQVNTKFFIASIFSGVFIEVVVVCILIALYEKVYSKKNVNEYTFSHDMDNLKNHVKS